VTTPQQPDDQEAPEHDDRTTQRVEPAEPPQRLGPRPPVITGPRRPLAVPPPDPDPRAQQPGWTVRAAPPAATPTSHPVPAVRVEPFDDRIPGVNTMAVAALVFSVLFPPAGIVLGHIAKGQIRRTRESGRLLATIALVIGYTITLCACCGPATLFMLGVFG
jgi:hypothetical protein